MGLTLIRILFLFAALYDFILGLGFLFFGPQIFERYNITAPNHWAFINFCCLLLMIFGLMFMMVAIRPQSNRNLIPFGVLLKAAYIGVAGYYWSVGGIPDAFKPFIFVDAVMLLAFVWAYLSFPKNKDVERVA